MLLEALTKTKIITYFDLFMYQGFKINMFIVLYIVVFPGLMENIGMYFFTSLVLYQARLI